jgi:hypothetical protein
MQDGCDIDAEVTNNVDLEGEEMSAIEGRLQGRQFVAVWARIATEREAGDSYGVIMKRLNAEHIPTPSGRGVWHKAAVRRLYQGDREQLREDSLAHSIGSSTDVLQDKQV